MLLDLFLRLSPLQVVTHPSADLDRFSWTTSSAVPFFGGHPSHRRPSPVLLDICLRLSPLQAFCFLLFTHPWLDLARLSWTCSSAIPFSWVTHPTADRVRCCLTFFSRLSPLQVVTHPSADLDRFSWTSSSAVPFFGGHPSHCRPSPVLLDAFLRLSPLQVVTHPSADLDRFSLTSSSAVPFFGGHPSHCRPSPVLLDFIFGCPVFRRSPIPLPTKPGAAGLHLRLSRFSAVTHPTADQARCCWTSSSAVPFSGGHPSHCRPSPVLLDLFLRLSPLQAVIHPSADLTRCCWTSFSAVPFFGGHPYHCRPSPVLLDFIFGCLVFRWSPIPLPTEPGAA